MQDRLSTSINSSDTSISKSTQLDYAVPASKIGSLSSGEFVGMVADNPNCKIKLKVFHGEIQNNYAAIKQEEEHYKPIPLIAKVSEMDIKENYKKIKEDIQDIFRMQLPKIDAANEPSSLKTDKTIEDDNNLSVSM